MFDFKQLQTNSWVFSIILGLVLFYARSRLSRKRNQRLPPGPKGIPVFGNFFQLSKKAWNEFEKWGEEYGPIVYIKVLGQGMLVLNSHTAACDLFDKRAGTYSDRRFIALDEILTRGLFVGSARYGDLWRKLRRGGHESMAKTASRQFYRIQEREALIFTEALLQDSTRKGWTAEVARGTASSIISAVYDLPTRQSWNDPLVTKINDVNMVIGHAAYPGNYLVEFFPWMKYLPSPIAGWKLKMERQSVEFFAFFNGLFHDVERQIREGDERPCVVGNLIRERERLGLNDDEASWLAAGLYIAGADTAAAMMEWTLLALVAYPDKQKKCQEELDAVVGRSRMPSFEDIDNLPYLKATVREVLRWRSAVAIGVQHVTTQDDWYQGYFIPKGTICFANIWSLNRDRKIYGPDAEDFNPDRFIDGNEDISSALANTKDGHHAYGFGPRICLGRHFANNAIFINIACLLWAATIFPVIDEKTGNPVLPDLMGTVTDGITVRPLPFEIRVKPRFAEARVLVAQTREMQA